MTNNLNSVIVEGNLTKDAEFDSTQKGTGFCNFALATNRYYKSGEEFQHEVSYLDVEAWGKLAESCKSLLVKGSGIRVVGRLKQDRWNSEDGKVKSRVKIVAEHIEAKPSTGEKDDAPADEPEAKEAPAEPVAETKPAKKAKQTAKA